MPKKTFTGLALIILLIVCSQALLNSYTLSVSAAEPSKLKIYVGPPKVLADNKASESIFIQLQDSKGVPARAQAKIDISLSSSLTSVGSVDPKVTISVGSTYAVAKFFSTYTPGSTTITATASGFATVQESITTVGPVPSKLAVYCLPPTLPADSDTHRAIVVQLQDASGSPAKAPIGDVNVTLASSNVNVGISDPFIVINAGSTCAVAMFNTTSNSGSATVSALSSGYTSGQATIKTETLGGNPTKLKVYVNPPKVPADGVTYNLIAVQLQDLSGKIAKTDNDLTVSLSSSNIAVGTVDLSMTINNNKTYAVTKFYSTYRSGATYITAAAPDYTSSQESITTVGPVPSKLAVYCVPSILAADGKSYNAILVQLQDSAGNPARDPIGNISIELFSSVPEVGNASSTLIIPYGSTHSSVAFFSTYTAGSTTITAITSGYASGQATMTTHVIDQYTLTVSMTAYPNSINSSEQTTIRVYVTFDGLGPVPGATIQLASDKGGNFSSITDEKNGYYLSIFTAPNVATQTVCTISANASKAGYNTGYGSVQVAVNSNVGFGSLRLYVKETGDIPISGASIISTSQPSGVSSISAITDNEGYVSFDNILAGTYTFQISKEGYDTKNEVIVVTAAQTTNSTVYVTKASPPSDLTLPLLIVIIIVVAVVIGVTATVIIRKRKKSTPQYGYGYSSWK